MATDPLLAVPGAFDAALREAVAHHILGGEDERIAFRHALLREAIYGDLMPGERTRLHGLLAELLSDESRLGRVAGSAAELAYHALASHDIPAASGNEGGKLPIAAYSA